MATKKRETIPPVKLTLEEQLRFYVTCLHEELAEKRGELADMLLGLSRAYATTGGPTWTSNSDDNLWRKHQGEIAAMERTLIHLERMLGRWDIK